MSDQPIREITEYQEFKPTPESYWRSAILFGRNSASYKFAFAQSLLEMAARGKSTVSLGELAEPYARRICEHLKKEPRQSTSRSSRFLDACRAYNEGEIPHDRLVDVTESLGFTKWLGWKQPDLRGKGNLHAPIFCVNLAVLPG